VKEFDIHHQKYIDEWHKHKPNVVNFFRMHTDRAYRTYLGWYQRALVSSCVSTGLMMTMRTVGPPPMMTPCTTRIPEKAHMLSRVPF
jgi:hypothetical protein